MLNDLVGLITKHLKKGERIRIAGFGILQVRKRPARMGRHFSSSGAGTVASVFADAELIDLFLLVGFIVGIWAVPRFGRIPMQVGGFAGMAIGMLLLTLAALANDGPNAHLWLVVVGFVIFNLAMNAGPNATTFTLAPILFPTGIRASASGFAAASAKVGATFGTFSVPQIQAAWGLVGVLTLMAAVSVGGLIATAAFSYAMGEEDEIEELPLSH